MLISAIQGNHKLRLTWRGKVAACLKNKIKTKVENLPLKYMCETMYLIPSTRGNKKEKIKAHPLSLWNFHEIVHITLTYTSRPELRSFSCKVGWEL
jgi:hypothetical protein